MIFGNVAAEGVARRVLEAAGWYCHQARKHFTKRRGRFITLSNDLWSCIDLAGVNRNDGAWMIQVTTTSGVSLRRRKIREVPWPISPVFRVSIFECRTDDIKEGRRKKAHWFRIHDLGADGTWRVTFRLDVAPAMMKAPPRKKKVVESP